MIDGDHAFVAVREWMGSTSTLFRREESLALLALRYLAGHELASAEGLATWAGITLGDARSAFKEAANQIRQLGDVFVRREAELDHVESPPTRLLGPFDPLLHGWASREMWISEHHSVVTTNGIFRAIVFSEGRAKGTWRISSEGVEVDLFESIDDETAHDLLDDVQDLDRLVKREGPASGLKLNPPA